MLRMPGTERASSAIMQQLKMVLYYFEILKWCRSTHTEISHRATGRRRRAEGGVSSHSLIMPSHAEACHQ